MWFFDNQSPVLVDGRTLVPVRGVFEALGFEVDWISATQTVTLDRSDFAVRITIGNDVFTTNGTNHTLDVPAQTIGGSTMLPIRAVLESVGYYLDWDGASQTVIIGDTPFYITIAGQRFSTSRVDLYLYEIGLTDADIVPLRYMVNLRFLSLGSNQITDITPLAGLNNLAFLWLHDNQITDITPLEGLAANFIVLSLSRNQITDITALARSHELAQLGLSSNPIADWSPVAHVEDVTGRPD